MSAKVCGPGEGEIHDAGAARIVVKATGEDTGGSFFLAESTIAPGFAGPPPHRHESLHDMFYVLDGTLTVLLGEQHEDIGAGGFVCVPPGVVHTFSNRTGEPVRLLNFNTPSGWEHYMRDLADAGRSGPLTPDVIGRVASRHDFHLA